MLEKGSECVSKILEQRIHEYTSRFIGESNRNSYAGTLLCCDKCQKPCHGIKLCLHLAIARLDFVPTRYREVVLTVSKHGFGIGDPTFERTWTRSFNCSFDVESGLLLRRVNVTSTVLGPLNVQWDFS